MCRTKELEEDFVCKQKETEEQNKFVRKEAKKEDFSGAQNETPPKPLRARTPRRVSKNKIIA